MLLLLAGLSPGLVRSFKYVGYGSAAPAGVPCLSCDGKVPGAALDLTHWTDNTTPAALYADTSTEISLNLARARRERGEYAEWDDALVVNNHYDTDGVLSVWACMQPDAALRHAPLLVAGAEAGDFGEWSSEAGVKLDLAVSALCTDADDEGYGAALAAVPALLRDFGSPSAGALHESLWRDGWAELRASWDALESGAVHRVSEGPGRIVLVERPAGSARVHDTALHRALHERGACGRARAGEACTRLLHAERDGARGLWRYEYVKPGHGWVQRLVERETVPLADPGAIAAALGELLGGPEGGRAGLAGSWEAGGASGLGGQRIGWSGWVEQPPEVVMQALVDVDAGASQAGAKPGAS
jgi:hypothetical protein